MQFDFLLNKIAVSCQPLLSALINGEPQAALGLRRSARSLVLAALYQKLERPILILTDRAERALTIADEISIWDDNIPLYQFPEPTPLFYEKAAWGETTRHDRLLALTILASYHIPAAPKPEKPPLLIAPARALMTRTLPRRDFLKASRTLRKGQTIHIKELARICVALGYEPVNILIAPGQFARRGGIFDLWPPAEAHPVRLDFFGEQIEIIRNFDPSTQRTIKRIDGQTINRFLITPAREFILKPKTPELENGEQYTEFHLPILHTTPASLLDYLPRQTLVVIDDLQSLKDMFNDVEEQAISSRQDYIQAEILPDNFPIPYLTWSEILDSMHGHQTLEIGLPSSGIIEAIPENASSKEKNDAPLAQKFSHGPRFGGQLKIALNFISKNHQAGHQQVIVSRHTSRLKELWKQHSKSTRAAPILFIDGSLTEGWVFNSDNERPIHLLTDGEIFGWRRPEPRRRVALKADAPESNYSDLQTEDWVVHIDHGIGRFTGLVQRTVENIEREYLCIEYADQAQLYVPVHQADRLTRYVGNNSRPPKISRLGSVEWRNVKSHVKKAVQEIAEDLLELYAKRNIVQGFAFSPDVSWQKELEASFPYIETDDQKRVLVEVKQDMQNHLPMDRLICGDVGYGKTEVALRAAFKAVLDGKQVAILVPTTVLAQQHYNTFRTRLMAFPVQVEMLSRFRTPAQQREIVSQLSQGEIDIVIGTHRLFSNDVKFKDLGLLIIDEEQRFGVTHKEKLKRMRTEVDILTLTATPIPRTLYMALSGVRDISTINTPPEERLPIVTHIGPYSPRLVRQAILREMERGGQVFFVHNRVQTIPAMLSHIQKNVPEARIAIAHGQMAESELAKRMEQFSRGDVDVLLTTSIIESGLDIPNANTLIIDRADAFGLAQLYQLRGRVGRAAQRAYAYFFRHKRKSPTPEGRRRLETIAENTQLGSGFSIAMRDLEIRGAGDILGTRQHGHIAAVGFHLYTSLLAEAVRQMRHEKGLSAMPSPPSVNIQLNPVNIELPFTSNIPVDYIPDRNVRLGLYRRMGDMRTLDELDTLEEEFIDRFGSPPEILHNLFFQLKIKILAEQAGLTSIMVGSKQLALRFFTEELPAWIPSDFPGVRVGKSALWFQYIDIDNWSEKLVDILKRLKELQHQPDDEAFMDKLDLSQRRK